MQSGCASGEDIPGDEFYRGRLAGKQVVWAEGEEAAAGRPCWIDRVSHFQGFLSCFLRPFFCLLWLFAPLTGFLRMNGALSPGCVAWPLPSQTLLQEEKSGKGGQPGVFPRLPSGSMGRAGFFRGVLILGGFRRLSGKPPPLTREGLSHHVGPHRRPNSGP